MQQEMWDELLDMAARGSLREPCSVELLLESPRPWSGEWVSLFCMVRDATEAWVEVMGRRVESLEVGKPLTLLFQAPVLEEDITVWAVGSDHVARHQTVTINPRWI